MTLEIKICGLTNLQDALKAVELGADHLGFILYNKSPRFIAQAALKALCAKLPPEVSRVGVFVNASVEFITEAVKDCSLSCVQLHGDEDLNEFRSLPVPIWKAVRISPGAGILPDDVGLADRLVLDTAVHGLYGGTGKQIDFEAAAGVAAKHRVMLGGGMNPRNVAAAIAAVNPLGVDVSSGVEAAPGIKDHAKLKAFIRAARSVPATAN